MAAEGVRAYRVVAKIKNNRLWAAIVTTFPDVQTQSDAGRALGVGPSNIGRLLNMTWWPWNSAQGTWAPMAQRIAEAVKDTPEYLFDGELYGRTPERPLALEFDRPALEQAGMLALPPATPEEVLERQQLGEGLAVALADLTGKQRVILEESFGLTTGGEEVSHEAIAARLGVTTARVWQAEQEALRKLRGRRAQSILRHYTEGTPGRPLPKRTATPIPAPAERTCAGGGQQPKPRTRRQYGSPGTRGWVEGECQVCARRRISLTKAGTLAGHKAMAAEQAAKYEGWRKEDATIP